MMRFVGLIFVAFAFRVATAAAERKLPKTKKTKSPKDPKHAKKEWEPSCSGANIVAAFCHGECTANRQLVEDRDISSEESSISYTVPSGGKKPVYFCLLAENDSYCRMFAASAVVSVDDQVISSDVDLLDEDGFGTSFWAPRGSSIWVDTTILLDTTIECIRTGSFKYFLAMED